MKNFKKLLFGLLVSVLYLGSVNAESTASITCEDTYIKPGESTVCTVKASHDEEVKSAIFSIATSEYLTMSDIKANTAAGWSYDTTQTNYYLFNNAGADISAGAEIFSFTLNLSTEAKNLPEGNCGQICISTLLFNQTTPVTLPDSGVCFGPTVDKDECTEEDCPTPDTGAFANYALLGGVSLVALIAIIAVSRKNKFYRV